MTKDRKEYMKTWSEQHKEERKAYQKAYRLAHKEESKAYYQAHKEEYKAKNKEYYQAHKEEYKSYNEAHKEKAKAYNQAHKEERKEYMKDYYAAHKEKAKAYNQAHKEQRNEYMKAYMKADVNSFGQTKESIRRKSRRILNKSGLKLPGYEIHHCFTYDDAAKFIYCRKEMHRLIHVYLKQHNIDADSDHFEQIKHLVDETIVIFGV